MLFYKAEGCIVNYNNEIDENRRLRRELARKYFTKSRDFNHQFDEKAYYYITDVSEGVVKAGGIVPDSYEAEETMQAYFKYLGCEIKDMTLEEITFEDTQHMLSNADRYDYIDDDDEVLEQFGLHKLSGPYGRSLDFGENLIDDQTQAEILAKSEKSLFYESLQPELNRIFTPAANSKIYGHPVHYLLQTDDKAARKEVYRMLLQSLHSQGRLKSKRYCFLDFKPSDTICHASMNALYQMCTGGSVVIRYSGRDNMEDTQYAGGEQDVIEKIAECAKCHRNDVLTILCLPRSCNRVKSLFYEQLGSMVMVELQEENADTEKAGAFLKMLAKDHHIRTDKALFASLEKDKSYLAPELRAIFDEWYNRKLRSSVYPQYKSLTSAKQDPVKAAPKGSAFEELQSMIGLKEAKDVMQKALNYYKIQKLYEEKGLKQDTPAMHMVFTGNPGTAKTTVARLFARIMKDNGLLSKGHLVEVGRGDLVGKYVGWTAKTVQAKFKDAIGGVLFIDEAYSLVDDRDGSFGDEAINTIVQEMENRREDMVVILAGYPDKMEGFMAKNPGLRSRIAFHVPFADYNASELCEIANMMGKKKGVSFDEDATQKLHVIFETASAQNDFGNGRYVRNVLEKAKMNQATRLLSYNFEDITTKEITTLKASDFEMPDLPKTAIKRPIGFAC